ncbi:MAG TPA: glycosyltransferase family 39 protein, partial [Terriglobia bacterium]|nr:glycosyltransferase family 39 protein [Terriglobia bacterium]
MNLAAPRSKSSWLGRDAFYFALIGIAEIVIFFNDYRHFFMGDTLLWIGYRYHSITDFFRGFIEADPTLWYRPLSQRTAVSVLYPVFGLNPIPYRVVSFILFFACTIAVFFVTERLTRSRRIAWFSTLFFAPHVTHAFTTYDAAFIPELVYTLFFVASVICWISWIQSRSRNAWIASIALFAGSLLSKETAVALPFTLLAVWLFFPRENRPQLRSLAPHFALLACYLVFAIGFLHIRGIDLRALIDKPGAAGNGVYRLVLGKNLTDNTSIAFSWAFSIARGIGQWSPIKDWMVVALKVVRVLICAAAVFALFSSRRKYVLTGLAWFLIAAAPTLPLVDHFLPYYIFGPLVGFSIAVGAALDWASEWLSKHSRPLAFAACFLVLG